MGVQAEKIKTITIMSEELSGITVVIIIGLGVLTFILLFIFAKRQIMRFALRSRRSPHIPIGHDANKVLKRKIEEKINLIPKILFEPQLLSNGDSRYILTPGQQVPTHYYRLKAVDDARILEKEITKQMGSVRQANMNLRPYLLCTLTAALESSAQRLIHQFCDLYEHARYDPNSFGDEDYQRFNRLLLKLVDAAKLLKSDNSRKSSPNRTPQKQKPQEKNKTLLDPARLHPLSGLPTNFAKIEADETLNIDSRPTILPISNDNETSV